MIIHFEIPTKPIPQKRHRDSKSGYKYDPCANDKKNFLFQCLQYKPKQALDCSLAVKINFYFKRPKSHYGTGKNSDLLKQSAPEMHVSKPDIDNLSKFVLDALTPTFFKDDSIISQLTATKQYADNDSVEVYIWSKE